MLLRLAYLGVTNALALLRLLPMSHGRSDLHTRHEQFTDLVTEPDLGGR